MTHKDFRCKQCGNCCLTLGDAFQTCVTDEDIHFSKEEGRDDVLECVDPVSIDGGQYIYDIWISPTTGEDVQRCPWLRKLPKKDKYICRIHEVKPQRCREYPRSRKHAKETGCWGFENN